MSSVREVANAPSLFLVPFEELEYVVSEKLKSLQLDSEAYIKSAHYDVSEFGPSLFKIFNLEPPESVMHAVEKRQAEFLAGRVLARLAMQHLGFAEQQVGIGPMREPLWPELVAGSITHNEYSAVVLAGLSDKLALIGCDIEGVIAPQVRKDIACTLFNTSERLFIEQNTGAVPCLFTLVFSAKETLYKALYPEVQRFFDFKAAEVVALDPLKQEVVLMLVEELTDDYPAQRRFSINYHFISGSVFTFLVARK